MWECGWDCCVDNILTLCTISWTIGAPLCLLFNGPTSWQCSQAYMFDSVSVLVIFSFGIAPPLVSAQCTGRCRTVRRGHNKWFRSPETGASLWAASPEKRQPVADGRSPSCARSVAQWTWDRFDGLMDVGVRTNEDTGRFGTLQAACWETIEEFSRVAGPKKVARADSTRELAEWGRGAGNGRTLQDAV